jgi:hypothetical protein
MGFGLVGLLTLSLQRHTYIAGGKWRGVKSGRNMQPFLRENPDLQPAALQKALRNKDSAMYRKAMDRAVDYIRREAARRAQVSQNWRP